MIQKTCSSPFLVLSLLECTLYLANASRSAAAAILWLERPYFHCGVTPSREKVAIHVAQLLDWAYMPVC